MYVQLWTGPGAWAKVPSSSNPPSLRLPNSHETVPWFWSDVALLLSHVKHVHAFTIFSFSYPFTRGTLSAQFISSNIQKFYIICKKKFMNLKISNMITKKKKINITYHTECNAHSFVQVSQTTYCPWIQFMSAAHLTNIKVNWKWTKGVCGGFAAPICGRQIYASITQPLSPPR